MADHSSNDVFNAYDLGEHLAKLAGEGGRVTLPNDVRDLYAQAVAGAIESDEVVCLLIQKYKVVEA